MGLGAEQGLTEHGVSLVGGEEEGWGTCHTHYDVTLWCLLTLLRVTLDGLSSGFVYVKGNEGVF